MQTSSEARNQDEIINLRAEIADLKNVTIKNMAETQRMSKVISRIDDGDAIKVRVTA